MKPIDRRHFLKRSLLSAAVISMAGGRITEGQAAEPSQPVGIIDTNVNLFDWPFRRLKYHDTHALVAKLKKHRVIEAWAGSYEALFSKDINGTNERLAAECREKAPGFLVPFGTVNIAWPDWEEDLRRCHEVFKMPGIRIYPGYQPYDLDHLDMGRLVKMTAERGLILQIVFGMEDPRVHHPVINVGNVSHMALLKAVQGTPNTKIQTIHFSGAVRGEGLGAFLKQINAVMDISRLESNGAVGQVLGLVQGVLSSRVPVERILFGSHAPYFPLETALLKLVESPLDAKQLEAIMQGNARRLLARA